MPALAAMRAPLRRARRERVSQYTRLDESGLHTIAPTTAPGVNIQHPTFDRVASRLTQRPTAGTRADLQKLKESQSGRCADTPLLRWDLILAPEGRKLARP